MKTKKLFELLALVEGVTVSRWGYVKKIVEAMPLIKVRKKEWADDFKNEDIEYYPLDLSNLDTWSTFDRTCIHIDFQVEDDKLMCNASIYNGGMLYGEPIELRFTCCLEMPDEFIHTLEEEILYKFESYAESMYEQHLNNVKQDWINNFKLNNYGRII